MMTPPSSYMTQAGGEIVVVFEYSEERLDQLLRKDD